MGRQDNDVLHISGCAADVFGDVSNHRAQECLRSVTGFNLLVAYRRKLVTEEGISTTSFIDDRSTATEEVETRSWERPTRSTMSQCGK